MEQLTKQFEAIVSRYYESDGDRNNPEKRSKLAFRTYLETSHYATR
ncbi:hypothetical protein [Streptococcus suis]